MGSVCVGSIVDIRCNQNNGIRGGGMAGRKLDSLLLMVYAMAAADVVYSTDHVLY